MISEIIQKLPIIQNEFNYGIIVSAIIPKYKTIFISNNKNPNVVVSCLLSAYIDGSCAVIV